MSKYTCMQTWLDSWTPALRVESVWEREKEIEFWLCAGEDIAHLHCLKYMTREENKEDAHSTGWLMDKVPDH